MALPSDVQTAVNNAIAAAQAAVDDAVDALKSGAAQMLAAAAILGGQGHDTSHPLLDEVINDVTTAETALSGQLGAAVAQFRAASTALADAMPAAPAPAA